MLGNRRPAASWADPVPGFDADPARELLAPFAALRQAVIYQSFLENIDPSERVYHRGDVIPWPERAAALA